MMFYKVMAIYTAAWFSVLNNLLLNGLLVLSVVYSLGIFALLAFFLPHFPASVVAFTAYLLNFNLKFSLHLGDTLKVSQKSFLFSSFSFVFFFLPFF